jgi:hypothetical protein
MGPSIRLTELVVKSFVYVHGLLVEHAFPLFLGACDELRDAEIYGPENWFSIIDVLE